MKFLERLLGSRRIILRTMDLFLSRVDHVYILETAPICVLVDGPLALFVATLGFAVIVRVLE